jgi:hypothetical protein
MNSMCSQIADTGLSEEKNEDSAPIQKSVATKTRSNLRERSKGAMQRVRLVKGKNTPTPPPQKEQEANQPRLQVAGNLLKTHRSFRERSKQVRLVKGKVTPKPPPQKEQAANQQHHLVARKETTAPPIYQKQDSSQASRQVAGKETAVPRPKKEHFSGEETTAPLPPKEHDTIQLLWKMNEENTTVPVPQEKQGAKQPQVPAKKTDKLRKRLLALERMKSTVDQGREKNQIGLRSADSDLSKSDGGLKTNCSMRETLKKTVHKPEPDQDTQDTPIDQACKSLHKPNPDQDTQCTPIDQACESVHKPDPDQDTQHMPIDQARNSVTDTLSIPMNEEYYSPIGKVKVLHLDKIKRFRELRMNHGSAKEEWGPCGVRKVGPRF